MTSMGFIPPPSASTLNRDVPCRKCQYNLRGLPLDSRCPECGTPVGFSTQGDMICYSDPDWTDTLRRGINFILWSVVAYVVAAVLKTVFGRGMDQTLALMVNLGAAVLSWIGSWLLTTPDPSGLGEDRYGTSRKLIRITLLAGVLQRVLDLAAKTFVIPLEVYRSLEVLSGLAALLSVVGTFATCNYLGKLALRIPDYKLAGRAKVLMWGIGIPLGLLIAIGLLAVFVVAGGGRMAGGEAVACAAGLCMLALVVFGIMYLFFLEKLAKQLKVQAANARRTWAGQTV